MPTVEERFWDKVDKTGDCWLWTASQRPNRYGQFSANGKGLLAHRVSYQWEHGPIPKGLEIDHLCRVRHCVKPSHLEAVTHQENIQRGANQNRIKTHCPQGHPYTKTNTWLSKRNQRNCKRCKADKMLAQHDVQYWRDYRAKRTAQGNPVGSKQ